MNQNIIKREDLRQTGIESKKRDKELSEIVSENSDYIMKEINELKTKIETKLNGLDKDLSKSEIENGLKEVDEEYECLNKSVNNSVIYLAKYNLKLCQTLLNSIRTQIDVKKDSLVPKSKFSFNTTFKTNPKNIISIKRTIDSNDEIDGSKALLESIPFIGFKNLRDCSKQMTSEETMSKDIQLEDLKNCVIEIYGVPNALKVNDLIDCQVFCGPITTSILISNCKNCLFKTSSQQLRIHSSNGCDLHIHVTSGPIIEDSKAIRFAPFDWSYDRILDDFKSANLDTNVNNWNQINDFDCLSTDKPSHNWSLIAVNE